jgi:hypothetical protein
MTEEHLVEVLRISISTFVSVIEEKCQQIYAAPPIALIRKILIMTHNLDSYLVLLVSNILKNTYFHTGI